MTADIHTCSYYCERPECVRRQRDELRERLEAALAQQPAAVDEARSVSSIMDGAVTFVETLAAQLQQPPNAPMGIDDELRVQAALLRTPEFMAQFDPDKFARQLERIAALAGSVPQRYDIDADPNGIRADVIRCVRAAMYCGANNVNPPPEGHWLHDFWLIGRAEAHSATLAHQQGGHIDG